MGRGSGRRVVAWETGVANGVLVVRSIEDCARLLRRVLTNAMEFNLQEDDQAKMWYLREAISGCVFRVVANAARAENWEDQERANDDVKVLMARPHKEFVT